MSIPETVRIEDGEIITGPGVYDLSLSHYHGLCTWLPSISSSGLRTMWNESPAHYWTTSPYNADRIEREPNEAFDFGSACHFLLLQGRRGFEAQYAVRPDRWDSWRTKDATQWRDDQRAAGLTVITIDDLENIAGMAKSLAAHPVVRAGALDGLVERSLVHVDPGTGVVIRSRPDSIPTDDGIFSDLKSCASVDDDSLQRSIGQYGYVQQAALVGESCKHVLGIPMHSFSLVFCEKTAPWCCRIVTLRPEDLARGEAMNRAMLHRFAHCMETGVWPGPGDANDAELMGLQPYLQARIDARLAVELPEIEAALYLKRAQAEDQ